jgi:NAD(P)H-hydrate epimerase
MITPVNWETLRPLLAPRDKGSHKGDYGHVLIVGGDEGYGGAALLAGEAAARCGAGLTSVATHPVHAAALLARRPELMVKGIADPAALEPQLARATVLVLGPGLGQSPWSVACFWQAMQVAQQRQLAIVLDADGLNLLSQRYAAQSRYEKWLLTPHPGEAARLLDTTAERVNDDRDAAARQLQARFGGAVILKGPGSLACFDYQGRQKVECCQHGNPGMASGGMGDVLSGVAGAMLAQGFELHAATRLAMCLHSKAADMAAADGERGLLASDLFPFLRRLLNP